MIKINEIFFSIQGESSRVGWPTVFIRTSGCHLRCQYCDTQYAYYEGQPMGIDEVLGEVAKHHTKYVCLTGGEPLLQAEVHSLMERLCDLGYAVSLETSGAVSCERVDPRVHKVIDIKTPDSGEGHRFEPRNLAIAGENTEYKFVICSERDFEWAERFCQEHGINRKSTVLYSPSFGAISEQWLAEKILLSQSPARLQLQLHKYIWSPSSRGV